MTQSNTFPVRSLMALLAVASLSLSACATKPDRRGPPSDRQGQAGKPSGEKRGPSKSSGTFMQPVSTLFVAMDTNQDKVLTRSELQSGTASEWAQFDRNPSATYFAQWSLKTLGSTDAMPTFMSFDRDFNGVIIEDEFSAQLERDFQRLDKNGDGRLERSEMIVAFQAQQGRRKQSGGQGERKQRGGGQGGGGRPQR